MQYFYKKKESWFLTTYPNGTNRYTTYTISITLANIHARSEVRTHYLVSTSQCSSHQSTEAGQYFYNKRPTAGLSHITFHFQTRNNNAMFSYAPMHCLNSKHTIEYNQKWVSVACECLLHQPIGSVGIETKPPKSGRATNLPICTTTFGIPTIRRQSQTVTGLRMGSHRIMVRCGVFAPHTESHQKLSKNCIDFFRITTDNE